MHVRLRPPSAQRGCDVAGEQPPLPDRVLGVRHGERPGPIHAEIRYRRVVTGRPGVRDLRLGGADAQIGPDHDLTARVDGEIGVGGHHRVGGVAGRPHDQTGVELRAVGQHHVPVLGGLQERVEVDPSATALQRPHDPLPRLLRHLGQDPSARLDQVEAEVGEGQLRVGRQQRGGQGQQLTEALHPREATAHDGHREQPLPFGTGRQGGRPVEGDQQPVADGDSLLDVLQTDGLTGHSRDRQGARHCAGRHHDDVVVLDELVVRRAHERRPGGVVDRRHGAGDDLRTVQVVPQRHRCEAGFDRSRRHLGQERLVRHVGPRVDHGDLGLVGPQPTLQPPRRVEPCVTATDHQHLDHGASSFASRQPRHRSPLICDSRPLPVRTQVEPAMAQRAGPRRDLERRHSWLARRPG